MMRWSDRLRMPSPHAPRWAFLPALLLALLSVAGCSGRKMDCASLDPALTYCPAPKPPRVTDLTGGKVVVQVMVLPDGKVAEARVLSSSGHPAWQDTVLQAVRRWRFKPEGHMVTRTIPFDFRLGGATPAQGSSVGRASSVAPRK